MITNKEIALFIPCYNEEERLNVNAFKAFIQEKSTEIDFFFIDDGSNDDTSLVISTSFLGFTNVSLIKLDKNLGKGNALRAGILHNSNMHYKFYGFIDADLDIPLDQVNLLYQEMVNSSILLAISKRGLKSNFKIFNLRSAASLLMVDIANRIIGYDLKLKDTQCGCKMLHKEIVEICFKDEFISEWLFDIELFLRIKKNFEDPRSLISEVNLHKVEKNGKSKFRFRQNLKIIQQLYQINKYYN